MEGVHCWWVFGREGRSTRGDGGTYVAFPINIAPNHFLFSKFAIITRIKRAVERYLEGVNRHGDIIMLLAMLFAWHKII